MTEPCEHKQWRVMQASMFRMSGERWFEVQMECDACHKWGVFSCIAAEAVKPEEITWNDESA